MIRVTIAGIVAVAGVIAFQSTPAQAAGPKATSCSTTWHFIKAAEAGRNVRADAGYWVLSATGGSDTWNQRFLFCRDPGWGANHYGIYSNATGRYWNGCCAVGSPITASSPAIYNPTQLFEVRRFDAKFWTIKAVGSNSYVYAKANAGYVLAQDRGDFLGGDNLFEISSGDLLG
jgi:hypothetical protein